MRNKRMFFIAIMIVFFAFILQVTLQSMMRPHAKDNFYFQKWSSEALMQTVSLKDLQKKPLETLNNIHIKPPGLDAIRAIFVNTWPAPDSITSLLHVDFLLYKLWALLYSFLGALIFLWVSKLTGVKIAIIASFIFLFHPASILYATLLDSTFLSSFLVFILYYALWKIKNKFKVSIAIVIFIVLALFFTTTIFQFPFIIVVGFSLFLFGMGKRKVLLFLLITGSALGLYGMKQYYKFGIISTSSFTGLNLNRSVGNHDIKNYWGLDLTIKEQESALPSTLTRTKKVDGQTNFNHINYLQLNQDLIKQFKEYVIATPMSQLLMSYYENLQFYFKPSSRYSQNVIVNRIPWRGIYEHIFSFPILILLILLLGIPWLLKTVKYKDCLASIGLILPGLYIFLATVIFEKGENMRFKYFLEPVLIVFLISKIYDISQQIYEKVRME